MNLSNLSRRSLIPYAARDEASFYVALSASRAFLRLGFLTPLGVSPKFSALTIFAAVHTMIVEQGEEAIGAVRIIKKDIPAEYGVLIQKFRLIDDTFFNVCFDNYVEGMQLLLRI
ncbi:MAG: hypothetical protein ACTTKG_09325, partial [Selenomonas sp.]